MTSIAWTGKTWNPIKAEDISGNGRVKLGWFCKKISDGCTNCYAESMNRYRGNGHLYRVGNADKVRIALDDDAMLLPLRWRTPRRIFPCSMTDMFLDAHTDEMLDRIHVVMAYCRRHTFQVLTKRPERALGYYLELYSGRKWAKDRWDTARQWLRSELPRPAAPTAQLRWEQQREYIGVMMADALYKPLPNLWLGVSAEHQKAADERIPYLLQTLAAVRWVSYEPALGPINFGAAFCELTDPTYRFLSKWYGPNGFDPAGSQPEQKIRLRQERALHWIVVGGESGRGARPFHMQWALDTIEQCKAGGAAPFVKQMGSNLAKQLGYADVKGEAPGEWPEELRVREYPAVQP